MLILQLYAKPNNLLWLSLKLSTKLMLMMMDFHKVPTVCYVVIYRFTINYLGITASCNTGVCMCNELGGNMARFTQFPIMITRSTIIYEIVSPGAAGSSIYI